MNAPLDADLAVKKMESSPIPETKNLEANDDVELNEENELIGIEIKCNHQRRSQLGGG